MNEDSKVHCPLCVSSVSSLSIVHLPCVPWPSCPVKREADSWTLRPGFAPGLREDSPPMCLGPCPPSAAFPAFPAGGTLCPRAFVALGAPTAKVCLCPPWCPPWCLHTQMSPQTSSKGRLLDVSRQIFFLLQSLCAPG